MINIAILDDDKEEALHTKKILIGYLQKKNLEYDRIDLFEDGSSLLHSPKEYDLLFLDIQVGKENGIDIAKELRKRQSEIIIVVVTSFLRYSMEGYKIQAARYLLKPLVASLLYSELDEVLMDYLEKPSILLSYQQEESRLKMKDIYYFESYGRKVQFHTRAQNYISKESVSYWATRLSKDFVECYKGIYVHVKYIEQIGKDTILLENKQILPLARRRSDVLRDAWLSYQEFTL